MHHTINLDLFCCLSAEGFSLDELVTSLRSAFEDKAFVDLLQLILSLAQEAMIGRCLSGTASLIGCCEEGRLCLNGGYNRSIRTSLGKVQLRWQRVRCSHCGKNVILLKELLGLSRYQSKSHELEQLVVDAVSKDSYRRAAQSIDAIGFVSVPYRTAHHWVMQSTCDELNVTGDLSGCIGPVQVMADGTKFKGQPVNGKAKRGDLKVVLGIDRSNNVFPIGSWTGIGWDEIGEKLRKNKVDWGAGSILISDGEPGLAEAFSDAVEFQQRCHWHTVRDLYHSMWQNGGSMKTAKPLQHGLAGALAIELPKEDFDKVSEAEKDRIEESIERVDEAITTLIDFLDEKGYTTASTYIEGARRNIFSYVRRWLQYGVICPRASSLIERIIRELGRRIKKIAYNWSDKGAGKIARIILKKFTNEKEWKQYWIEKMKITGKVIITVKNCRASSQHLAH